MLKMKVKKVKDLKAALEKLPDDYNLFNVMMCDPHGVGCFFHELTVDEDSCAVTLRAARSKYGPNDR